MTTNDDQKPKDTTEADSSTGVSCAAAAGSEPDICMVPQPEHRHYCLLTATIYQTPTGPVYVKDTNRSGMQGMCRRASIDPLMAAIQLGAQNPQPPGKILIIERL